MDESTAEGAVLGTADLHNRMSAAAAFFYLFAGVTVASGFMVIASRNPVASVLFLILAFVNAAGLFVMMGPSSSR